MGQRPKESGQCNRNTVTDPQQTGAESGGEESMTSGREYHKDENER